ncbi:hypothetical protein BLNAU_20132 [Blattamonas nauphoetae]|uniref:Uncharacterized protein n=1 Tax=Blattamonas nauphoetae TaxID=2049346 RepID=A0ABQ9WZJ7_9EUKA|nr:hypothetical protein BLNAU_20132 [Blattamonas nauphoetae]
MRPVHQFTEIPVLIVVLCRSAQPPMLSLIVLGRVVDCGCAEGMMDARTKREHRRNVNTANTRLSGRPQHPPLPPSPCPSSVMVLYRSRFLDWDEEEPESEQEKAVIFQSLVATVKIQPVLDDSLEEKAVQFLESVDPQDIESADAFLRSLGHTTDESSKDFVQSIVVLVSSPSQAITTTAMKILESLSISCSARVFYPLVKADLLPQLITSLNPLSLSFAEAVGIHTCLMSIISSTVWLTTPTGLEHLGIEDESGQQTVHKTVLKQVLIPSEKYICHLCANRFSIVDGDLPNEFMTILAQLLRISPSYQPTAEIVLHMPVFLTIPSCLTFFEKDFPIWDFLRFGKVGSCRRSIHGHSRSLLRRHPHPPTPLCLSLTTHTLPLPSASPSPPTPSHSSLPLPHHPHPPTPLCLSLTTHTLPLPSASPSPPTPSHSPLPLPHHPHPPTPLCLSLTSHTLPVLSVSPLPTLAIERPFGCHSKHKQYWPRQSSSFAFFDSFSSSSPLTPLFLCNLGLRSKLKGNKVWTREGDENLQRRGEGRNSKSDRTTGNGSMMDKHDGSS